MDDLLIKLITAIIPIGVAIIGIIPAIVENRKKTEKSIRAFQEKTSNSLTTINDDINNIKTNINTVNDNISVISKDVNDLRNNFNYHMINDEEAQQKQRRVRIIRFSDEIREGLQHTDDHWDEINEDINEYELYCERHKDYRNNKGKISMNFIKETYAARLRDKNFNS